MVGMVRTKESEKERKRLSYIKHADKWNEQNICHICGGSYLRRHKSSHINTEKHKHGYTGYMMGLYSAIEIEADYGDIL